LSTAKRILIFFLVLFVVLLGSLIVAVSKGDLDFSSWTGVWIAIGAVGVLYCLVFLVIKK